jgi:anaphase-promoting complex subunit 6
MSLACRYLAAQCMVRLGKWEEALDMVGRRGLADGYNVGKGDGGIKVGRCDRPFPSPSAD